MNGKWSKSVWVCTSLKVNWKLKEILQGASLLATVFLPVVLNELLEEAGVRRVLKDVFISGVVGSTLPGKLMGHTYYIAQDVHQMLVSLG